MARRLKAVEIERLENTSFASAAGLVAGPQAQAGCQQCSVVSCVAYSCNSGCSGATCVNCTAVTVVGVPPVGAITTHTNDAHTLYSCPPPPPGCGNPYTCAQASCGAQSVTA